MNVAGSAMTPVSDLDKESIAASFLPTSEFGIPASTISDSFGMTASSMQRNAAACFKLQVSFSCCFFAYYQWDRT